MPVIIQQPVVSNNSSLLEIVQAVCNELMIDEPSFVIGNTSPQIRQLLALLNRLGTDIARQHNWQRLVREHEFTTIDGQALYALPQDWMKQIEQTEWDRTSHWPLVGPATDQQWQVYKSGVISQGPRIRFRIANGSVEVFPAIGGYNISFFYISKYWIESQEGQTKGKYTQDSDVSIYPDSLLITGLKTLWKAAKGLDGTFDAGEFRSMLEMCKAQDRSAPKLSLSPMNQSVLISMANVVDGNWPGN